MKQKDAVYAAVKNVLEEHDEAFSEEHAVALSDSQRGEVNHILFEGFKQGSVDITDASRKKYDSNEKLLSYSKSLVGNWLKRDTRLTGGKEHVPNPDSARGPRDEQIKHMNMLLKAVKAKGNEDSINSVEKCIEARKSEIAAKRAKSEEIDSNHIPDSLKHLL